jgi:hypothetical protein
MLLAEMQQKLRTHGFVRFFTLVLAAHFTLTNIHCWELIKSVGSNNK